MSEASLAELAAMFGIESSYVSEKGERCVISEDVKRNLLDAMEVEADDPRPPPADVSGEVVRCYQPEWLAEDRAWGVTVQLYGVRSRRNFGIGDFEDLARLAEIFAPWGADFIGVNPLNALFFADAERASPYSPSSRRFLNPIYIAVDRVRKLDDVVEAERWRRHEGEIAALRDSELVAYGKVAALKRALLEIAYAEQGELPGFDAFCETGGQDLHLFAVFETLSEASVAAGHGSGWKFWPPALQEMPADELDSFCAANAGRIRFHKWLQWIAAEQLAEVQQRALKSGMRIGLYLDLPVGVSADGAAAWSEPQLYAARARIGAPPDMFNRLGQDWGLAPMKPGGIAIDAFSSFERELGASIAFAGAMRLDHVMSLSRLWWLPEGSSARDGGYVRYPFDGLLQALGRCSQAGACIIIGEDLGTVPDGFREKISEHGLLGYRVLYFERAADGCFRRPQAYPVEALACVSTHDLPTLRGWWLARDIDTRVGCAIYDSADDAEIDRAGRRVDCRRMLDALRDAGLLDQAQERFEGEAMMQDDIFVAVHRFLARTPCRLVALQLEDLAGSVDMVNMPGTDTQHANWRRKLPVAVEDLAQIDVLRRTVEAVAGERPRRR
jgi:4-alpha-glucanotransferase